MMKIILILTILTIPFLTGCGGGGGSGSEGDNRGDTYDTLYTVTFYDNNIVTKEQTVADGTTIELPHLTKTGYTFDGWLVENAGTPVMGMYEINQNIKFYAKWIQTHNFVHTITFYDNNMVTKEQTVADGTTIELPHLTKTGYTFDGWLVENAGTHVKGMYEINQNIKFYAKWIQTHNFVHTITFYDNNMVTKEQTVADGTTIELPHLTKTGYTFDGWLVENAGTPVKGMYKTNQNTKFYAKWIQTHNFMHTVTFYDNNIVTKEQTVADGTTIELPHLTKTGYTFDGWLVENAGTPVKGMYKTNQNTKFYAKWDLKTHSIAYVNDNKTENIKHYNYNEKIILPTLKKFGYVFNGWTTKDSSEILSGEYTVTEGLILYANWSDADRTRNYTVQFYDDEKLIPEFTKVVKYGEPILLPYKTSNGKYISYWKNNGVYNKALKAYLVTEDTNLHAYWSRDYQIEIRTAADLESIKNGMDKRYKLMNDISLAGYDSWAPIGLAQDRDFTGWFDGNGYKITDMNISSVDKSTGLFFRVTGVITNLTMENVNIQFTKTDKKNQVYNHQSNRVGSIAAKFEGTLSNIKVSGSISTNTIGNEGIINPTYVGGVVGYAGVGSYWIENTMSAINITSTAQSKNQDTIGGIAGIGQHYHHKSRITNCHNTGKIDHHSSNNEISIGGILGANNGNTSIVESSNSGEISASGNFINVGGMVGLLNDGNISASYNNGEIRVSGDSVSVGGLVGLLDGGNISASYNSGGIKNSRNNLVGGLVGSAKTYYTFSIENSYNSAELDSYFGIKGGIVGSIIGNSADSEIVACYNSGKLPYHGTSGGIVGKLQSKTIIKNCATFIEETSSEVIIAGIIDYNIINIFNNFRLKRSIGSNFYKDEYSGYGKSLEDFKKQSTFSDDVKAKGQGGLGWKFGNDMNNPWKMHTTEGFPILYWQQ